MGAVRYQVPPNWRLLRDGTDRRVYTVSGTPFQILSLRRFDPGERFEAVYTPPERTLKAWELARLELMTFRSRRQVLDVELVRQKPFPDLGGQGYLMVLRARRTNGLRYQFWLAGRCEAGECVRVLIALERSNHLEDRKEDVATFLDRLQNVP